MTTTPTKFQRMPHKRSHCHKKYLLWLGLLTANRMMTLLGTGAVLLSMLRIR